MSRLAVNSKITTNTQHITDLSPTNMSTKRRTRSNVGAQPLAVYKNINVDRSGSMYSMNGKQIPMIHTLLHDTLEQARTTNTPTFVTLNSFDDTKTTIMNGNILDLQIPTLQRLEHLLCPRGSTRFNDTLIEQLDDLIENKKTFLNGLAKKVKNLNPTIVTVAINVTDGQDNMSDHSLEMCLTKMQEYRKNGGQAILMAANMDAVEIGKRYGFDGNTCITVDNSDEKAIESGFSAVLRTQREMSSGFRNVSFTPMERTTSQPISNLFQTFSNDVDDSQSTTVPTLRAPPMQRNRTLLPRDISLYEQVLDNQHRWSIGPNQAIV
jgi:hypothetical protein